jgi:hypothetical protein
MRRRNWGCDMVKWNDAVKELLKLVPATTEMIDACRRTLDRSDARHAVRGDYWSTFWAYFRLTKALLMTFDVKTSDHPKYYAFGKEIAPYLRKRYWENDTKQNAIRDSGRKWQKQGLQDAIMVQIVLWAEACYALDDPNIQPDPKPKPMSI